MEHTAPKQPPEETTGSYKKLILCTLIGLVAVQQAVSAIGPTIVHFVEREFNYSPSMGAFVYSIGTLGTILMAPVAGVFSDYWGRRRCILYGGVLAGVFIIILSLCPSVYLLFPPMFIKSIGFAMVSTSVLGYITDITPAKERGMGMGFFGVGMTLGAIIGVGLGTNIVDKWGGKTAYALCGGIALLGAIGAFFLTKETKRKDGEDVQKAVSWENIKVAFGIKEKINFLKKNRLITMLTLIALINSISWGVALILSTKLVESVLGKSIRFAGLGIIVGSVIMLLGSFPAGKWVDKIGVRFPYLLASCFNLLGLIIIASAVNILMYLIGWALLGAAHTIFNPAGNVFIARHCPPQERGLAFGLIFTSATLGIFLGPLATAPLIDLFNARLPFFISFITSSIATVMMIKYIKDSYV